MLDPLLALHRRPMHPHPIQTRLLRAPIARRPNNHTIRADAVFMQPNMHPKRLHMVLLSNIVYPPPDAHIAQIQRLISAGLTTARRRALILALRSEELVGALLDSGAGDGVGNGYPELHLLRRGSDVHGRFGGDVFDGDTLGVDGLGHENGELELRCF